MTSISPFSILFVGGGNMASAMIGGLLNREFPADRLSVIDPDAATRERHAARGLLAHPSLPANHTPVDLVIWAVKPQSFREASLPVAPATRAALHLSVAAGLTSASLSQWLGTERIVRAMPNTPALMGLGQTGLFARPAVTSTDRQRVEWVTSAMGESLWLADEALLDAVTAVSGSGPAYVFYVMEAMMDAAVRMGLSPAAARQLTLGTFQGASALALASEDPPSVLRERVTSKGGTTFAALEALRSADLAGTFATALEAARARAQQMGIELGQQ